MQDDIQKQIAADLGISELSQPEQEQLISQFGEIALKAATIALFEHMAEDKRDAFAALAEGGDAEALQTFLTKEVPDHEAIAKNAVDAEVRKFKEFQNT